MHKEIRMVTGEFKAIETDGESMVIEGYPITFNAPATHFGMTEVIDALALEGTDLTDVPLRYNHEESFLILARTRNGSLELTVDDVGLKMRASLIDTSSNKDIYKSIQAGLLDKMSFAFTVDEDDDDFDFETDTRTIKRIKKLWDVSVVDVPYYDSTSLSARKLDTSMEYVSKIKAEKRKRLAEQIKREELIRKFK